MENLCKKYHPIFLMTYRMINSPSGLAIYQSILMKLNNIQVYPSLLANITENWYNINKSVAKITMNLTKLISNDGIDNESYLYKTLFFSEKALLQIHDPLSFLQSMKLILEYPYFYDSLSRYFFILSNIRRCDILLNIKLEPLSSKRSIERMLKRYNGNLPIIKEHITGIGPNSNNKWGSHDYATACSMFYTLIFLQKYYKTPLRQLNIGFLYKKKYISPKNITTKMYNLYQLTNKPLKSPPQNYVIFFSDLKKRGFNLWYTVSLLFRSVYLDFKFINIPLPVVLSTSNIPYQEKNNQIGVMCYILVNDGILTNTNLFKHFNN